MRAFSFSSLRFRLIFLILMTIMPLLALILYAGLEDYRLSRSLAFQNALNLAINVSQVQNNIIDDSRQLLSVLAQMLQMNQLEPSASSAIFTDLLKKQPLYTAFLLTRPDGEVVTSVPPIAQHLNVSGRPYYQRVLQTGNFVIGEYIIGAVTGKAVLPLAYPIPDDAGHLQSILLAGLDLNWVNQYLSKIKFPPEASFTMIDSNGTILLRYPHPENFIGKSMPEEQIVKSILAKGEGVEEAPDSNGVPHLYGFTSFGQPYGTVYVTVGIPNKIAFAEANQKTTRNLVGLAIVALLAFATAEFGAHVFIIRPVDRLLRTSKLLAKGDLTVRTGWPYGRGEIAQLASSFDQMAESLQSREAERRRAEKALRESEERYRNLFEESRDAIYITARDGQFIDANQSTLDLFGYTREEMIGRSVLMMYANPADRPRFQKAIEKRGFIRDYELKFRRKDGKELDCLLTSTVRQADDGSISGYQGIIRDITERKKAEEELKYLGTHDALTGLYNRAFFEEEIARVKRGRHFPVSVIMADVNDLKKINDSQGHAAGDELLRRVGEVLGVSFRAEDVAARIGGDEFAMLLRDTDARVASEALVRLKNRLAVHNAAYKGQPLCLSIGAATAETGDMLEKSLNQADERMYAVKQRRKLDE